MNASNKQNSFVKNMVDAWEKKNAKGARAGGVSLMALSLAACGSDDTATSTTTTTTTTTTVTPVALSFTVGADALSGTTGNDTFTATKSSVLNNTDTITGGTGADSIVFEDLAGTLQLTSTGVENVTVSPQTASAALSVKNMSDIDILTVVNGDEGIDITNVTDMTTTYVLDGVSANKTVEVQYVSTSTEGAADETTVTVADSGSTANDTTFLISDATNGASTTTIETVNVVMAGTTTSYLTLDADAATVKVTGAGDARITVQAASATVDASAATGNANIVTGAGSSTVTGGAGDDTIKIADSTLDVVDGGAGTDTLSLTNVGAISKTGTYSNIEIIDIAAANVNSVNAIDVDTDWAGFTEFKISGGATTDTITIDDAPDNGTLHVTSTDTDLTAAYDYKTDGAANTLNISLGTAGAAATVAGITADDPETVNLTVGAKDGQDTNAVTLADATTMTIAGSGNSDLGNVTLATGTGVTIDASSASGNLTYTMVNGAGASEYVLITGGSGKDTVTLEANSHDALDSVDLGGGTDKITMSGITAVGALTDYSAETVDLVFGAAGAALTTDLRLSDVGTLNLAAGTLGENLSLTSLSGSTEVQLENFDDTAAADTVSLGYAAATGDATVVIQQFGLNDTGTNGENLTITGTTTATIKMADTVTGDTEGAFIDTLNVNTLTGLEINLATAGAEVTSGDIGGQVDIDTLTAAALTTLTLVSASDNTNSINIDASSTDTSLTSIDGTGLSGTGHVTLGTGASIIDRAGTATITLAKGDDNLSFSMTSHGSNVIDLGTNTTTTAAEDGDLLAVGGVMTGNLVVDLSSTTDQITTMNGVANAAVQKGIESIDLTSVTVASGTTTITGSSGANHIKGTDAVDTITAGLGTDQINSDAGADSVVLTESTASIDKVIYGDGELVAGNITQALISSDTIVGFTAGASGDIIEIDISTVVALIGVDAFVDLGGTAITSGATVDITDVTAGVTISALTTEVLTLAGAGITEDAIETALEVGGSRVLVTDITVDDAIIVASDNGVDTHLYIVAMGTESTDDTDAEAGNLTAMEFAVLKGLAASEDLHADNFNFVA
jgi:hypothetical protein